MLAPYEGFFEHTYSNKTKSHSYFGLVFLTKRI